MIKSIIKFSGRMDRFAGSPGAGAGRLRSPGSRLSKQKLLIVKILNRVLATYDQGFMDAMGDAFMPMYGAIG